VVQKVFSGITAPAASAPLRNQGQSMHVLTVLYTSESAAVTTGVQIRMEASFDNTFWFPVSADITSVPLLGSTVYTVTVAYAPWPYIRVAVVQTPASKPLDVWYAGHFAPVLSPTVTSDRVTL
jgi:hypothetical protein